MIVWRGCAKVPLIPARFASRWHCDLPHSPSWSSSFLHCHCRRLAGSSHSHSHAAIPHKEGATVFYRWPAIRHCRLLSRWKLYQIALMTLFLPPATLSYQQGSLPGSTLLAAYVATGGTLAILLSLSHVFTRVVGEMAYLPEDHQVRLSTLTFLGGRRDVVVTPEEILTQGGGGVVQRLELVGSKKVYLYSLHYGHVINTGLMEDLLTVTR